MNDYFSCQYAERRSLGQTVADTRARMVSPIESKALAQVGTTHDSSYINVRASRQLKVTQLAQRRGTRPIDLIRSCNVLRTTCI